MREGNKGYFTETQHVSTSAGFGAMLLQNMGALPIKLLDEWRIENPESWMSDRLTAWDRQRLDRYKGRIFQTFPFLFYCHFKYSPLRPRLLEKRQMNKPMK
ncbi:hypothetical protein KIL84_005833 [Mauremys mutica]|uniref:Uncharacterized protein n=1 Tax=Mauremys mutica TaxID=74926 RepID=A0A9D3XI62_9SAUR|nr:hypothetical protein KIL84_005833 [Mauremys mutica]